MKQIVYSVAALVVLASCGAGGSVSYDPELCTELSKKIERHDSLTQDDYSHIIDQNGEILKYLVGRASQVSELPDSSRTSAWRALLAEPEYLERFGYMFTLGSALYQADTQGRLDKTNSRRYAELDRYNERLAEYTDRY